jgi:hypothetical protein
MGSGIEGSARHFLRAMATGEKEAMDMALKELRKAVSYTDVEGDRDLINRYRDAAVEKWDRDDGSIEIDADAVVAFEEPGGAYVHAWIWVKESDVAKG